METSLGSLLFLRTATAAGEYLTAVRDVLQATDECNTLQRDYDNIAIRLADALANSYIGRIFFRSAPEPGLHSRLTDARVRLALATKRKQDAAGPLLAAATYRDMTVEELHGLLARAGDRILRAFDLYRTPTSPPAPHITERGTPLIQ